MGLFQKITGVGKKSSSASTSASTASTSASNASTSASNASQAPVVAASPADPSVTDANGARITADNSSANWKAASLPNLKIGQNSEYDDLPLTASGKNAVRAPQPDSSSGMRFEELYRMKGVLGSGAFSTVRDGYHKSDPGKNFAIKCVDRDKLTEEDAIALIEEVAILKEFDHEHIICLYDFFEESRMYYLVMEQMSGGELFDRIVEKAYYNEKEARDVCKILLKAVGYCHENSVAHRDLKPENLLLVSRGDDARVKIADFGFAKRVTEPKSLSTQCGTPGYVAPEILEGHLYDTKADMWSIGVILYILLGGYPPFIENDQRKLFRKIRKGDYEFHDEYWGAISKEAKTLIGSLLTVKPSNRLSAWEALQNSWITEDEDKLAGRDLGANLSEFKKFNAKRKFKAAVKSVVAVNKLASLGIDFQKHLE